MLARRNQGARTQHDLVVQNGIVEDQCAHADQAARADAAGMQDGAMAHGHLLCDHQTGPAGGIGPIVGDVTDGTILNVAACANANALDIAAQYRARPDRHVIGQSHLPDDRGIGVDVNPLAQLGVGVEIRSYGHGGPLQRNVTTSSAVVGWMAMV